MPPEIFNILKINLGTKMNKKFIKIKIFYS